MGDAEGGGGKMDPVKKKRYVWWGDESFVGKGGDGRPEKRRGAVEVSL